MPIEALGIYLRCIEDGTTERSISEAPFLGDIEQQWLSERTLATQYLWSSRRQRAGKLKVAKLKKRLNAPLSAYSTYSQRPLSTNSRFTEFDMEELMVERNLRYIRTVGYNSIRPIGIGKTMRELEQEKNGRQENGPPLQNAVNCQPVPVENRDEFHGTTNEIANMIFDLDQGIQSEQEESYNYDDEFDRVEDVTVERRPTEQLPAGAGLYEENSQHQDSAAYVSQELDPPEDGSEFTEIPSLTISDTVVLDTSNEQISRVSSLGSGRPEAVVDNIYIGQ
ncbi:Mnd2p Ecym_3387 [Eremothecium cymbalariae DBVPG|uniref:Uncharacterized protein n=1 Tax=Eremothecium cymbalariae (strain CBS 270.75 / DBVPG 7215 / KCTC 17166 / NRRL Y-17582) TaxID=931890 RepID=G8JRV5_ERECY|nr:Hypothetical protein Ecym_3387 [Eremothecium cymbalariae DBVPG\